MTKFSKKEELLIKVIAKIGAQNILSQMDRNSGIWDKLKSMVSKVLLGLLLFSGTAFAGNLKSDIDKLSRDAISSDSKIFESYTRKDVNLSGSDVQKDRDGFTIKYDIEQNGVMEELKVLVKYDKDKESLNCKVIPGHSSNAAYTKEIIGALNRNWLGFCNKAEEAIEKNKVEESKKQLLTKK